MSDYFSDRHNGPIARTEEKISHKVWVGLVGLVRGLIKDGAFAFRFPKTCPDGAAICGVDEEALSANVQAEMPGLSWPLQVENEEYKRLFGSTLSTIPNTLLILDFIEYVYGRIAKPINGDYHSYFRHYHLDFDQEDGQREFREDVNRIFSRNAIAYEMQKDGKIVRLLPQVLDEALIGAHFNTGDIILDNALNESRAKFSSPNPLVRREALERLWDAWERLKSSLDSDKKRSINSLLDRAASETVFRELLESEAHALTKIGNSHLIRHYEVNQVPVVDTRHVDYLYHRLFAMVQLLIVFLND